MCATRLGTKPAASGGVVPILTCPTVGSARKSIAVTPCLRLSKIALADSRIASPYGVTCTPLAVRSKKGTPNSASRPEIALDTAGCEMASSVAALPIPRAFATASTICRSRILTRDAMLFVHFIFITAQLWGDQIILLYVDAARD